MEGICGASWRRVDVHGVALGRVEPTDRGHLVEGWETAADGDRGWSVWFAITVDDQWRTRDVQVEVALADGGRVRELRADGAGSWVLDGKAAPELDGCLDVDVAATPLTNTLPIRRLELTVGESREIVAAWIDVPGLEIEPARQRYARLPSNGGRSRYEFTDMDSGRRFELTVDEHGLVVDYARFARRLLPR